MNGMQMKDELAVMADDSHTRNRRDFYLITVESVARRSVKAVERSRTYLHLDSFDYRYISKRVQFLHKNPINHSRKADIVQRSTCNVGDEKNDTILLVFRQIRKSETLRNEENEEDNYASRLSD
ncbi:CLUMA_CG000569, isoform A [Clunio marinus]|uniref:CLUMA_CG000569, isoform A n=1 Tax=Clunio marinus TaxID=568069 RepID=A0A1J1HFG7_9DIPT|nr:CLUMA_CG000569, isoform A [Clunio marinus]